LSGAGAATTVAVDAQAGAPPEGANLVTRSRGSGSQPEATAARSARPPVGLVRPSASWWEPGSHETDERDPRR